MKLRYDKATEHLTVDICCNREIKVIYDAGLGLAGVFRGTERLRTDEIGTKITVSEFLQYCETTCKTFHV